MKNIKLLLSVILAVLVFTFLKTVYYLFNLNYLDDLINSDAEGHLLVTIYILTLVLLFVAHISLSKGLWHIITKGYYNIKSIKTLNLGGILFVVYGSVTVLWKLYIITDPSGDYGDFMPEVILRAIEDGYTIILGFGIITIASILKDALVLKSENDLTV